MSFFRRLLPLNHKGDIDYFVLLVMLISCIGIILVVSLTDSIRYKEKLDKEFSAQSELEDKIAFSIAAHTNLTLNEAIARLNVRDQSVLTIPTIERYLPALKENVDYTVKQCKINLTELDSTVMAFNYQGQVNTCKRLTAYQSVLAGGGK